MSTHKRFSPSSLSRIINCPGSLQFIESLPEGSVDNSDNIHSRRGTSAHAVGEMTISAHIANPKTSAEPEDYEGMEVEEVIIDEKIIKGVKVYTDYIVPRLKKYKYAAVEENLGLLPWAKKANKLGVDCEQTGGTMDFIGVIPKILLHIVDYKNGYGYVEHINNPQTRAYGLFALLDQQQQKFKEIELTIVQPNAEGEPIRSEILTTKELLNWGEEVLLQAMVDANDPNAPRSPGEEQCKWCPGRAQCTAAFDLACDSALIEFDELIEGEITIPAVETLSDTQRRMVIENGDMIIEFVKACKTFEHSRAERGNIMEGYKLVAKRANRSFIKNSEIVVKKILHKLNLQSHDFLKLPELKSPAQIEEICKKKGVNPDKVKKLFDKYVQAISSGTNLVKESAAGKPIQSSIERDFAEFIESDLMDGLVD